MKYNKQLDMFDNADDYFSRILVTQAHFPTIFFYLLEYKTKCTEHLKIHSATNENYYPNDTSTKSFLAYIRRTTGQPKISNCLPDFRQHETRSFPIHKSEDERYLEFKLLIICQKTIG